MAAQIDQMNGQRAGAHRPNHVVERRFEVVDVLEHRPRDDQIHLRLKLRQPAWTHKILDAAFIEP